VDDLGLVERMRQGDDSAFAELFARYESPVFRYAAHMCGRAAADDIVQEAFLAWLRQIDRYDPARGGVLGYLLGIARHAAFRRLGASQHEAPLEEAVGTGAVDRADPFEDVSRSETIERVRAAVGALPPVFRDVIVLCELNELDYAAAAVVIGCPIGTVRSRLHRARSRLLELLASMRPGAVTIDG